MGHSSLTHLVILQVIGLSALAYISSAGAREGRGAHDRTPAGVMAMEARNQARVDIRGSLKCPMPETNTGRACALQIVDHDTGNTLRIIASDTAMRMYQDGQTQVVASGTIRGDSLKVITIRAE
jgi:hypothetical protein